MALIAKSAVVGSYIIKVHSSYQLIDGYDCAATYFTTDGGLIFQLPCPGYEWEEEVIPPDAEELPDRYEEDVYLLKSRFFLWRRYVRQEPRIVDLVWRVKQQPILGVFCRKMDDDLGFYEPDDAVLLFEDGSRAYCVLAAPHGTGTSGLHYVTATEADGAEELVDYFSIPLESS